MFKQRLLWALLFFLVYSPSAANYYYAREGICLTPSVGAHWTEGVEGPGYENVTGITEIGAPDEDSFLPANLPGGCREALRVDVPDATATSIRVDHGSLIDLDTEAVDWEAYIYIAVGLPDGDRTIGIGGASDTTIYCFIRQRDPLHLHGHAASD